MRHVRVYAVGAPIKKKKKNYVVYCAGRGMEREKKIK